MLATGEDGGAIDQLAGTACGRTRSIAQMPPKSKFADLLGIDIATCTPEQVICRMVVTADMSNRNGVLHGGALMTLADTAAGTASFINSPAGVSNVTVDAATSFIRAVRVGDTVTARCAPLHAGPGTMVLRVTMTRSDGKTVGIATQTHLFLDWKGDSGDAGQGD